MVTEEVMPLVNFLETDEGQNKCIIGWGIHQISVSSHCQLFARRKICKFCYLVGMPCDWDDT